MKAVVRVMGQRGVYCVVFIAAKVNEYFRNDSTAGV
jgi:hypothetical protein